MEAIDDQLLLPGRRRPAERPGHLAAQILGHEPGDTEGENPSKMPLRTALIEYCMIVERVLRVRP